MLYTGNHLKDSTNDYKLSTMEATLGLIHQDKNKQTASKHTNTGQTRKTQTH